MSPKTSPRKKAVKRAPNARRQRGLKARTPRKAARKLRKPATTRQAAKPKRKIVRRGTSRKATARLVQNGAPISNRLLTLGAHKAGYKPALPHTEESARHARILTDSVAGEMPPETKRTEVRAPKKRRTFRKAALEIPPILLEGDPSPAPAVSGRGQRDAHGPTPPAEHLESAAEAAELPEAYGTKELMLVARDPHWLYAHWDLSREQQRRYNACSADGHLILLVYAEAIGGKPAAQMHVHPESRHWFVHVARGGTRYLAELGYNEPGGKRVTISTSGAAVTPPDDAAPAGPVKFATIPVDVPFTRLVELVKTVAAENVPLAEAIEQLRAKGHPELPAAAAFAGAAWTPEQERALAEIVNLDQVRRVWIGSQEITELVRGKLRGELASTAAAQSTPSPGALGSVSSPFGSEQGKRGFWFNLNAELVIYGATEPGAKVTLAGQPIELRPDGTFGYRYALPDGQYDLPAVAISADETDGRAAQLKFSRATEYRGEVGAQPQDPKLKPPPENG